MEHCPPVSCQEDVAGWSQSWEHAAGPAVSVSAPVSSCQHPLLNCQLQTPPGWDQSIAGLTQWWIHILWRIYFWHQNIYCFLYVFIIACSVGGDVIVGIHQVWMGWGSQMKSITETKKKDQLELLSFEDTISVLWLAEGVCRWRPPFQRAWAPSRGWQQPQQLEISWPPRRSFYSQGCYRRCPILNPKFLNLYALNLSTHCTKPSKP